MAKLPRAVAPGFPHHLTQRGHPGRDVFYDGDDYAFYIQLLGDNCQACGVAIQAWCLMPDHVHLLVIPPTERALAKAIADTNRRYSWLINRREGIQGSLWKGRFASCALDEPNALFAARHIETNPVRAKLVQKPEDWPWSSARAHLGLGADPLIERPVGPGSIVQNSEDWSALLQEELPEDHQNAFRQSTRVGRPFGSEDFISAVERRLGRYLRQQKPGRKANRFASTLSEQSAKPGKRS